MGEAEIARSVGERAGAFDEALIPAVQALVTAPIQERVLGSRVTTFAIGGALRAVVTVNSVEELSAVRSLLHREAQSVEILGNGSNLLISDEPLDLWVIKLGGGFRRFNEVGPGTLEVFGATPLMTFSRKVSDEGLSGLEFAAGIPASLGGAIVMNAGAHGSEIGSRVAVVRGVLPDGSLVECKGHELPWSYRYSGLPKGVVVTSSVLQLIPGDKGEISGRCAHNLAYRKSTQPLSLPSAGSVFKNPSRELAAGALLERLSMKGFGIGGARVSELHANWIVNAERTATARDVLGVIEACQGRARAEAGIVLEPEVRVWRPS